MKNFYSIIALLFVIGSALAQKTDTDFVLTTAGDTLRGRILVSDKGAGYVVLRQADGSRTRFGPTEARSYGEPAGVMGVSQPVGPRRELRFVRPLVQGPTSLYSGQNADNVRRYYIQTPDTTYLAELVPVQAQLLFNRLLSGCPSLQFGTTQVQQRYPLTYAGLTSLLTTYNNCRYPQQPSIVLNNNAGVHLSYGVKVGPNYSGFALSPDDYQSPARQQTSYQAGAFLQASYKSHLGVQLEALYVKLHGFYQSQRLIEARFTTIDYAQVQLPLMLRYTFGLGKVRPFLMGGGLVSFNLQNSSNQVISYSGLPSTRYNISTPEELGFGLTGAVGTSLKLGSLPELGVEVRYDRVRYGNYVYFTPQHSSLRLDFSVMLHDK